MTRHPCAQFPASPRQQSSMPRAEMTDHQFLRSIVESSVAAFMPGVSGPFGNSGSRSEEIPVSKIVAAPPPAGPAEASQSCRLVSTHDTNSERSIMPFEIKNRQIEIG